MIIKNGDQRLILRDVTAGDAHETLPTDARDGCEVTALALGTGVNNLILVGTVDGGSDLSIPAGGSAVLYRVGNGWETGWNSTTVGGFLNPLASVNGGTGTDLSGALDGEIPFFASGALTTDASFTWDGAILTAAAVATVAIGGTGAEWAFDLTTGAFIPNSDTTVDFGGTTSRIKAGFFGLGTKASVILSSGVGVDAEVLVTAVVPGIAGNTYTVEVVAGVGLNVPLSAAEVGTVLTVTLGTDGAGVLDDTKNTATLVMGAINGAATLTAATLPGSGAGIVAVESQILGGGAEGLQTSGGIVIGTVLFPDLTDVAKDAFFVQYDHANLAYKLVDVATLGAIADPVPSANGGTGAALNAAGAGEILFSDGATPATFGTDPALVFSKAGFFAQDALILGSAALMFFGSDDPATDFSDAWGFLNVDVKAAGTPAALFKSTDTSGGADLVQIFFTSSESPTISAKGNFEFQNSGDGTGASWFGFNFDWTSTDIIRLHSDGTIDTNGTGTVARSSIGSGTDGTVALVADTGGIAGNSFTVEVATWAPSLSHAMTAAYTDSALLVKLGTDGAGVEDATKNTATLIAGAINTAAGGLTATASGTGATPLTAADIGGPTALTGGAESVTSAGGFGFSGTGFYLPNLPASDPGIPGLLYHTAGAVMVSV